MYGYVVPKKDCLKMQDFVLYRAFYCGICKATGSLYGQFPRFTTNYDIVFLSVFVHDISSQEVCFNESGCICNPFKKKATVCRNALMDKLVAANIILSYYKAADGIIDKEGIKHRAVKKFLKKSYYAAKSVFPEADNIVKNGYDKLRVLEELKSSSIDRVADTFAAILMDLAKALLKEKADENSLKLCYNIGKFVYLIDALDDIDEDYKKSHYNPFLYAYSNYKNRNQFIKDNKYELTFILSVTVNRAIECFNNLKFSQSFDLLQNIVYKGLRDKCDQVLTSKKKLPRPKI